MKTFGGSSGSNWRSPNASEANLIADWALKIRLNHSIAITKGTIAELVFAGIIVLGSMSVFTVEAFLILLGVFGVPILVVIILHICNDNRRQKQLISGDYLIMDSSVIKKEALKFRGQTTLLLYVTIPYGIERNFKVFSSVYDAVTHGTPGFLIRFDTKKPVNQGVAKAFYPAIPLEE